MQAEHVLEELGLTDAEASIYLTLLEAGPSHAGEIISKTGFHRATTYQILKRLKEQGYVSSIIRGKKQQFEAASPECFLDELKGKERKFKRILPTLKAKEANQEQQDVTVYNGVKGIRSALDKMLTELRSNGTYYDFGVSGLFRDVMGVYWDIWQERKKRYNITSHVIFNKRLKRENKDLLRAYVGKAKFHPPQYNSVTDTMIYNDTVILLVWTASPPIAVVIKNKNNANSYKNQFKLMWKHAT
ncbi:MAG: hypothetical protein OXR66_07480 [Candidatus Woesearchaeota archaeon]|nr:hypothetical protein [Candidatus Woesearchaeota archaeon]